MHNPATLHRVRPILAAVEALKLRVVVQLEHRFRIQEELERRLKAGIVLKRRHCFENEPHAQRILGAQFFCGVMVARPNQRGRVSWTTAVPFLNLSGLCGPALNVNSPLIPPEACVVELFSACRAAPMSSYDWPPIRIRAGWLLDTGSGLPFTYTVSKPRISFT